MSQVELRPYIDGRIPARGASSRLLQAGRADVEVVFLERVGDRSGRVEFPVDSRNEVVAPLAEGTYFVGVVCPAMLGADGRVAMVYPPLQWGDPGEGVPVGDAIAHRSQVQEDHRARIEASEGLIGDLEDFNRDVVDPALVGLDHALTVDIPDARDRASQAQSKALEALGVGQAAQETAEGALHVANLAEQSAAGLIEVGPSAPGHAPGRVWMKTETITNPETDVTEDRLVGMYQSVDGQWHQYTLMTGLLIVPGEDGTPTIIDESGMVVGSIAADAITTEALAADSVGAKQLIIGEISRAHLDEDVDGSLADADAWAERVVIEPSGITISRGILGGGPLTGLRLEATSLDFIVDGQPVAYMDSELNQMGIRNVYVEDAIVVGEHQIRRLGQGNITLFQWVGE